MGRRGFCSSQKHTFLVVSSSLNICSAKKHERVGGEVEKGEASEKKQLGVAKEKRKRTGRIFEIFLAGKFREFVAAGCREFFPEIYGSSTKSRSGFVRGEI